MAFENVYLTKEEKEKFKRRSIDGPYRPVIGSKKLGCGTFPKGTIDRERKIYLFYCGRGHYDFETPPEDYYFALVWDDITGDRCVSFCLHKKHINSDEIGDVLWFNMSINIPKGLENKKELFIETFKEAMCVYGLDGDPNFNCHFIVKFDF